MVGNKTSFCAMQWNNRGILRDAATSCRLRLLDLSRLDILASPDKVLTEAKGIFESGRMFLDLPFIVNSPD